MTAGIKKAGGISFGVSMNTGGLQKNVAQARKMLGGFVSGTKSMMGQWQSQLAGMVATGSLLAMAKQSFVAIDALYDTAKNINVTTEALSSLGYAAEQSGGSQSSLESALTRVSRSTTAALDPAGKLGILYSKMGLNAKELLELSPDQQFNEIAEAVKRLGNEQEQLVATQAIFGKSAGDLVETLRLGKDGLKEMTKEAERFGATIRGLDAERVAKAADEMKRAGSVLKGISNDLAIEFGPKATGFLADVATGLSRMTGGDAGENRAEKDLRHEMDRRRLRQEEINNQVKMRMANDPEMIKRRQYAGLPTHEEYIKRRAGQKQLGENTVDLMKSFAPAVTDFAKDFALNAKQLAKDALANPITSATGKTWGGAIMQADLKGAKRKSSAQMASRSAVMGDFEGNRSDSLAAYQQRVRGAAQFNKSKDPIQKEQLAVQKQIRDSVKGTVFAVVE